MAIDRGDPAGLRDGLLEVVERPDEIDELVRSRGLMLIAGSFNLAAGLAIVLGHNVWSGGALTVVVTLIGWLVALRGVVRLFTPQEKLVQFYKALHFERWHGR